MEKTTHLSPYQTRPIKFQIHAESNQKNSALVEICFKVRKGNSPVRCTRPFRVKLNQRLLSETQRITYLHPGDIVSYAILRPPPKRLCQEHGSLPVIIGLHGAGLEADSMQVRRMLDAAYGVCAWVLFPSGVTSWSGDDWREYAGSFFVPKTWNSPILKIAI